MGPTYDAINNPLRTYDTHKTLDYRMVIIPRIDLRIGESHFFFLGVRRLGEDPLTALPMKQARQVDRKAAVGRCGSGSLLVG